MKPAKEKKENEHFRYRIVIQQDAVIEFGLLGKIKANHLAVLDVANSLFYDKKSTKLKDKSGDWTLVSSNLISEQLPIYDLSPSRCRALVLDLCKVRLLERHPDNGILNRAYLRPGMIFHQFKKFKKTKNDPKKT